jgi:hypothetical protein
MQKHYADRSRSDVHYAIGELVYLDKRYRNPLRQVKKLERNWDGPFTILRRIGEVAYELKLPRTWKMHPVVWVGYLKPHRGQGITQEPPENDDEGFPQYVIQDFDDRVRNGVREYLVHWKDYPAAERTWETEDNLLKHARKIVEEYNSPQPISPRARRSRKRPELRCYFCEISTAPPDAEI